MLRPTVLHKKCHDLSNPHKNLKLRWSLAAGSGTFSRCSIKCPEKKILIDIFGTPLGQADKKRSVAGGAASTVDGKPKKAGLGKEGTLPRILKIYA